MINVCIYRYKAYILKKKKYYGLFLGIGFNYLKGTDPLWGDSLLFTTKSPEWKAELTLELPSGFEHWTPRLGMQHLNHKAIACNMSNMKITGLKLVCS